MPKNRAISRDPAYFPDPEKFDPERWFGQNGKLRNDLSCYAFGFGRRYVCSYPTSDEPRPLFTRS